MKLLILACLVTLVAGGTRRANPGEAKRAIDLWKKFCEGGRDGGEEGNIFIHCKHPLRPETRNLPVTQLNSGVSNEQREQYIFVQPAPIHFNHHLKVTSNGGLEPKTIVYVKPGKTSHTYDSSFDLQDKEHQKPELVFLEGAPHGEEAESHSGSRHGGYGVPKGEYAVPNGEYGVPNGEYGVPNGGYAVPNGEYGVPNGGYGYLPPRATKN